MRRRLASVLKSPLFWLATAVVAIILVPFAFIAGAWLSDIGAADRQSGEILSRAVPKGVIDEESGSYRGVARGDSAAKVRRILGKPAEEHGVFQPQVAWNTVWNGVYTADCRKWRRHGSGFYAMAYREVYFTIVGGRVCSYEVAGNGWSTTGGTKAGDGIDDIRGRFGEQACTQDNYTENPFWKQWNCTGRTESGIRMQFSGDPVSSIAIG